ncbi:MAG TPA: hypothetical protein VFW54_04115, partial [Propionibacteriaceae bacterium]|nr:hypothetical protein [Propionibacteriaceae bacterium]
PRKAQVGQHQDVDLSLCRHGGGPHRLHRQRTLVAEAHDQSHGNDDITFLTLAVHPNVGGPALWNFEVSIALAAGART